MHFNFLFKKKRKIKLCNLLFYFLKMNFLSRMTIHPSKPKHQFK